MPRERSQPHASGRKEWVHRLDRLAGDLNVLLVMFAIGLATLDLTFLVTERVLNRLPQVTHVVYADAPPASASSGPNRPDLP